MDGAIRLLGQVDMTSEEGLPRSEWNTIHLAVTLPLAIDPKTPCDPNAPMPPYDVPQKVDY
jgi:hypothetical protein